MQKSVFQLAKNRDLSSRCGVPWLAILAFLFFCLPGQEVRGAEEAGIQHSFLGVGNANHVVIVNEDGEIAWKLDLPASDGWVLPNGNVLLALYATKDFPNGGVVEVERETKKIVFQYKDQQKETSTVLVSFC